MKNQLTKSEKLEMFGDQLTLTWGFKNGQPAFKLFKSELDLYVNGMIEVAIDKEFNNRDCE